MPRPDRWLNVAEQAEVLGVKPAVIPQYVQRYGPDHPNPYPTHVDGQHKRFGRSTAVSETALRAWDARRPGTSHGQPRKRPPGVTVAQWRAIAAVHAGKQTLPRHLVTLTGKGLVRSAGGGFVLTKAGERLLEDYPHPGQEA
jgi:hypothetical protein